MMKCLHCKTFHENNEYHKCPDCGYELLASSNPPEDMVKKTMEIEIASRGAWIQKMNTILGYDNSDGFHSEPCPNDIARELRKFVQDVANDPDLDLTNANYSGRARSLISKLRTPPV